MIEYRLSVEDDELDDFDEGGNINVDDDMGDYGMDEEEEELTVATVTPVAVVIPAESGAPEATEGVESEPAKKPVKKAAAAKKAPAKKAAVKKAPAKKAPAKKA